MVRRASPFQGPFSIRPISLEPRLGRSAIGAEADSHSVCRGNRRRGPGAEFVPGGPPSGGFQQRLQSLVQTRGELHPLRTSRPGGAVAARPPMLGHRGCPHDLAERRAVSSVDVNRPGPRDDPTSKNVMRSSATRTMWCCSPFHVKLRLREGQLSSRWVWSELGIAGSARAQSHVRERDCPR